MGGFGFLGSIYMFFLVALLIVALGSGISYLFHQITNSKSGWIEESNIHIKGGSIMENNAWFRYAMYSFLGILILVAIMGLLTSNSMSSNMAMMPMGNMSMGGNSMGMAPMGNMQMGGGMGQMGSMGGMMPNGTQMNGFYIHPLPNGGIAIVPMNGMGGVQMGNMPMNNNSSMGMMGGNMGGMMGNMSGGNMNMPMGGMQMGMGSMGGMGMMGMPMGGGSSGSGSSGGMGMM